MTADVEQDMMTLMQELGLGEIGTTLYTPLMRRQRGNVAGILVEQRNTAPTPDVLTHSDTVFVNVQVRGGGQMDRGKQEAAELSMRIYRAMSLILDRVVDGTLYLSIYPDSAPYPVEDGDHVDYLLGLEVKRYYEELS